MHGLYRSWLNHLAYQFAYRCPATRYTYISTVSERQDVFLLVASFTLPCQLQICSVQRDDAQQAAAAILRGQIKPYQKVLCGCLLCLQACATRDLYLACHSTLLLTASPGLSMCCAVGVAETLFMQSASVLYMPFIGYGWSQLGISSLSSFHCMRLEAVCHRASVSWLPCLQRRAKSAVAIKGDSSSVRHLWSTREGHADGRVDMANSQQRSRYSP